MKKFKPNAINYPKITRWTLLLSLILMSTMVPGGPVETRSFVNIESDIVLGFNIFLTLLMVASILILYFTFKKQRWAYQFTGIIGFTFASVFALDLARIFPVSLDPMSSTLFTLEWISLILGIVLMWLSYKAVIVTESSFWSVKRKLSMPFMLGVIFLLLLGIYVVYFATSAALTI